MNLIADVEFELAYFDSVGERGNHYTTRTMIPNIYQSEVSKIILASLKFKGWFFPDEQKGYEILDCFFCVNYFSVFYTSFNIRWSSGKKKFSSCKNIFKEKRIHKIWRWFLKELLREWWMMDLQCNTYVC